MFLYMNQNKARGKYWLQQKSAEVASSKVINTSAAVINLFSTWPEKLLKYIPNVFTLMFHHHVEVSVVK